MSNENDGEAIIVESVIERPNQEETIETTQRRRATLDEHEVEKKRGRRLFGSLLGTLDSLKQDADSPRAKERLARQAELEARRRVKEQQTNAEIAKQHAEKEAIRAQELEKRSEEFKKTQEAAKYEHRLALAQFLGCEPPGEKKLYWLPWKLTQEQENCISEQIACVKNEEEGVDMMEVDNE